MIRKFISVREASEILGLSESTLRGHKAGTASLTRVKQGRSVRLILQEVEQHAERLCKDAKLSMSAKA